MQFTTKERIKIVKKALGKSELITQAVVSWNCPMCKEYDYDEGNVWEGRVVRCQFCDEIFAITFEKSEVKDEDKKSTRKHFTPGIGRRINVNT